MQRASEWRHGFCKAAEAALAQCFKTEKMSETEIGQYAAYQVGRGLPFLSVSTTFDPVTGAVVRPI